MKEEFCYESRNLTVLTMQEYKLRSPKGKMFYFCVCSELPNKTTGPHPVKHFVQNNLVFVRNDSAVFSKDAKRDMRMFTGERLAYWSTN